MYRIKSIIRDGLKVCGYRLIDRFNQETVISLDKALELAHQNLIYGVRVTRVNGEYRLVGSDKVNLREVPTEQLSKKKAEKKAKGNYKVISRILDGRRVIGYVIVNSEGKSAKINLEQAVNMAYGGELINVYAQKYNDGSIKLRSRTNDGIPSISVNETKNNNSQTSRKIGMII